MPDRSAVQPVAFAVTTAPVRRRGRVFLDLRGVVAVAILGVAMALAGTPSAVLADVGGARRTGRRERRAAGAAGQTTAEYALVLIGAAALALLLITWATKTDRIGQLFNFVIDRVKGNAG